MKKWTMVTFYTPILSEHSSAGGKNNRNVAAYFRKTVFVECSNSTVEMHGYTTFISRNMV
jgi:hypothetical protein